MLTPKILYYWKPSKSIEMKYTSTNIFLIHIIQLLFFINFCSSSSLSTTKSSIVFTTLGRCRYSFDIYTLPITSDAQSSPSISKNHELKLTDGISVNFNGHFPLNSAPIFSLLKDPNSTPPSPNNLELIYVTERNGTSNIYFDSVRVSDDSLSRPGVRSALELQVLDRLQIPILKIDSDNENTRISMKDRPSLVGENLIYVSTHENTGVPRTSWVAVYSTHIPTGSTSRSLKVWRILARRFHLQGCTRPWPPKLRAESHS